MTVVQGVEHSASGLQGPVSDRTAHVCVRCAGQFTLALESAGEVKVDKEQKKVFVGGSPDALMLKQPSCKIQI